MIRLAVNALAYGFMVAAMSLVGALLVIDAYKQGF